MNLEYKISFKSSVKKDLKNISKSTQKKILEEIQVLKKNPFLSPKLKGKFEGLRRFRIGNFRVIYTILDKEILILKISDRKEAYKKGQ
jgi:mRNA interferase RelE/StbE